MDSIEEFICSSQPKPTPKLQQLFEKKKQVDINEDKDLNF